MPEGIRKLIEPVIALPPAKRWLMLGIVVLSAIFFGILIVTANRTEYKPLYSNLGNEDAGEIMNKLKEQKVPTQISDDGKTILVPASKVYELRMSLASDGLPQGGGVGFEIFDRKNFGMTEFVQKINYQRAMQGELSRTIAQLSGVEQARVHLALPEQTLFKENEKAPTASVVLKMKSGRVLSENEVQGVIHLVASSVEGMDPDHITVIDNRGRMLSRPVAPDQASRVASAKPIYFDQSMPVSVSPNYQVSLERTILFFDNKNWLGSCKVEPILCSESPMVEKPREDSDAVRILFLFCWCLCFWCSLGGGFFCFSSFNRLCI